MNINQKIQGIASSSTLAITARAKELRAQGCDVVNFAGGEPDFDTPDLIKDAAIQAIHNGFTKYTPSIGMPELREAIRDKFKKENSLDYKINQVAVGCGAKHVLYSIFQVLAEPGDEVLIPSPYWVSYPQMVKLAGAIPHFIPTSQKTNFKITKELLSEHITEKTKMLIINSPSNPTGVVYTKEELRALADICVQKNIIIISDEIYEKLTFDLPEYTSIASLGKDIYDLTVTVNGVSKAFSMTGWRIGYCAGPEELIAGIKKLQDHSTSNPTSISQAAAIQALRSPKELTEKTRNIFIQRRNLIVSLIEEIPEISYVYPSGAFYLFCNLSQLGDTMDVSKRILNEANVAFIPGGGFGAPDYARLSYATSEGRIQEGIKRIVQWIQDNK